MRTATRKLAVLVAVVVLTFVAWTGVASQTKDAPIPVVARLVDDWSTSCWATMTAWGTGAVLAATAPPEGWVVLGSWVVGIFGAYATAVICTGPAEAYYGPANVTPCFTAQTYKGTYAGVKFYTTDAVACSVGAGGGGGGGGSW